MCVCVCVLVPSANLILFTVASFCSLARLHVCMCVCVACLSVSFTVHNCKENVIKDFLLYNKKAHQRHTKTPSGEKGGRRVFPEKEPHLFWCETH